VQEEIPLFREVSHACPYLPERECSNLRFTLSGADPDFLQVLLEDGFRHFGDSFFVPSCPSCTSCIGVRIPVKDFIPNRSQKRCLLTNQDLTFQMGTPQLDEERLRLLNAFQLERWIGKDWTLLQYSEEQYRSSFFWDSPSSFEVTARDKHGRLLAAGIIDITENALSATYHYHDPRESKRGLGTWLILREIEYLQRTGRSHLYLGLWNEEVPSLRYKTQYQPVERFLNRKWVKS